MSANAGSLKMDSSLIMYRSINPACSNTPPALAPILFEARFPAARWGLELIANNPVVQLVERSPEAELRHSTRCQSQRFCGPGKANYRSKPLK